MKDSGCSQAGRALGHLLWALRPGVVGRAGAKCWAWHRACPFLRRLPFCKWEEVLGLLQVPRLWAHRGRSQPLPPSPSPGSKHLPC